MKPFQVLVAVVALVLVICGFANADTLRTAPFPGYPLI